MRQAQQAKLFLYGKIFSPPLPNFFVILGNANGESRW
jgi:hypothetical protein